MPDMTDVVLKLPTRGSLVDATIDFNVTYSPVEQALIEKNLRFHVVISLMANDPSLQVMYARATPSAGAGGLYWPNIPQPIFDPAAVENGAFIRAFPDTPLDLPQVPTATAITKHESHTFTVPRAILNEDPTVYYYGYSFPQNDEIKARVTLYWDGLPFPPTHKDSDPTPLLASTE